MAVEPEAGRPAQFADEEYAEAGATVDESALDGADLVVSVQPLPTDTIRRLPKGTATISFLPTIQEQDVVRDLRDCGITAFAMELVPRISRAQSMDALSSQALVAGYRCAIVAAGMLRRFFPLNMTAAGTVQPATVVVLGAGVAGLQAIATAKRLGAVVQAYDVRAAAAEEIALDGCQADRARPRDARGRRRLRPRDDRGTGGQAARAADAVHRRRGRADHHRRRPRPAGRRCW